MNARVSNFAALLLCVSGLSSVALANDKNPPRFNGPYHQDRNPLAPKIQAAPIAHSHHGHVHHSAGPSFSSFGFQGDGGNYGGGGYGYFPGYGVGTAFSSELFGRAEVLRGAGEYNLLTSQALINLETARSANMDNQKKYAATFFEKRRIHDEAIAAAKEARLARAAANRAKVAAAPVQPIAVAVVRVDGKVQWPVSLSGEAFAAERDQLDTLLAAETTEEVRQQINSLVEVMRTKLLALLHNRQIKTMDYLSAKKFLASLEVDSNDNQPTNNVAQR